MNSKVTVVGDEAGSVISQSKDPEYGYVKVTQNRVVYDNSGFVRIKPVSALLRGTISELQSLGYKANEELPGNIIIEESLTPFNSKNPERDLKVAGATGIVCTVDGAPIYRRTRYSTASNAEDIFQQHDNIEELRAAFDVSSIQNTTNEDISRESHDDFNL